MERVPRSADSLREVTRENEREILLQLFDAQLAQPEKMQFREGSFDFFDLTPEVLKDSVPVLFVTGFGKSPQSYRETLFEIYVSGRRVIGLSMPTEDVTVHEHERTENIPEVQTERALTLLYALIEKGIERADVVTHSEGGMNAAVAATIEPERFRNFVFIALPGVTSAVSYFEIAKRGFQNMKAVKQGVREGDLETRARYKRSNDDIKQWVKRRGGLKAAVESMNPGRVEIGQVVRDLHNTGHGVSIIAHVDDKMLPMAEYQRNEEDKPRSTEELGIDGFYSVVEGHSMPEVDGREGLLVANAIDALAHKYASKPSSTT